MMTKVTIITAVMCLLLNVMVCEIRFAFSVWRHGARAPDRGLNAQNVDILGETWTSKGELTPSGMRMHYLLGTRNRNRWSGFISNSFDPKELYVASTDFNRTIMSVLSHLQGLYPPGTGPTLTAGQAAKALPPVTSSIIDSTKASLGTFALGNQVQVIPVHVFDANGPYFIYSNPSKCGSILKLLPANAKMKENVDVLNKINTNWGAKLKVALNLNDDTFLSVFENMYLVADSFVAAYVDDRALKRFTDAGINLNQFLEYAHEFEFNNIFLYYNGDADKMFAKIGATPKISDVLRWMDTRIANDVAGVGYTGYAAPKLALYSAHDITLGTLQTILSAAFSLSKYETPYASSFIWELYRPDGAPDNSKLTASDYTVKIAYNDVNNYLSMSYAEFKNKLQSYLLSDQQLSDFCGWTATTTSDLKPVPTSYIDATIVLSVLLFCAVVALIILTVLVCRKPSSGHVFPTEHKPVTTV